MLSAFVVLISMTFWVMPCQSQGTIQLDSTILQVDTIITGLNVPWELQWGPDGDIWTTERNGIVSKINPVSGNKTVVLDISDQVYQKSESGLLGLVLHPEFTDTGFVYLVYTYVAPLVKERMVRYFYNGDSLINPFVMVEGIEGNSTHIGSRLLILPDSTLIMTTGEAQNQPSAQDTTALTGKVLRYNLDGTIPSDNPIPGSPVWSWGHRNAQGLFLGPNGILYSSEHGPTTDDEINLLVKGGNYGWPNVHGFCDTPNEIAFCDTVNVTEPVIVWSPTIAPSDITWYDGDAIPEFKNTLLLTVLKKKKIVRLTFDKKRESLVGTKDYFTNKWGRLRDILQGPDGELYIATNGESWGNDDPNTHFIIKLSPVDSATTSVNLNSRLGFKIYPNPNEGNFNIELGNIREGTANIFDLTGKLVYSTTLSRTNNIKLPSNKFGSGIYFLDISFKGLRHSTKLIIK